MSKYKVQIQGGMYSVVDVLEAFAQKQATALTVDPAHKLVDASIHSMTDGALIGEVVLETEVEIDADLILRELASQFIGIGFKIEPIEETASEANS